MLVTDVIALDKNRSRIWLDNEFAFVLYKGELRRFKIEKGSELGNEQYREIMEDILPKRARLRAMNLLLKRTYSEKGLRDKLKESFYPGEIIDDALDYVIGFGYIDDKRIAEEYIRIHLGDKSRNTIIGDLKRRGISPDIVKSAFEECSDEGFEQDEVALARNLLRKKGYEQGCRYERKEYAKFYSFLMRKGFDPDTVRQAMGSDDIVQDFEE